MLRKLTISIAATLGIMFSFSDAFACECGTAKPLLDDYESVNDVFIAKIVSLVKAPNNREWPEAYRGVNAVVLKVYKGSLKPGQKLFFRQGDFAYCTIAWNNESIGDESLIFQNVADKKSTRLNSCGGRKDDEDLRYLENMDKLRGKTRISGAVVSWRDYEHTKGFPKNPTLRLVGNGREYQVKVGDDDIYEIYDIEPGDYRIFPDITGWVVSKDFVEYGSDLWLLPEFMQGWPWTSFPISVKAGRHARLKLEFVPYNPVTFKVIDQNGNPLSRIIIMAYKAEANGYASSPSSRQKTDANGIARITVMEPGKYRVYANIIDPHKLASEKNMFYSGMGNMMLPDPVDIPVGGINETIVIRHMGVTRTMPNELGDTSPAESNKTPE